MDIIETNLTSKGKIGMGRRGDPKEAHHGAHRPTSTPLEDRIAIQRHDIETLLLENQRLAASHVALKQELALSHQDIRRLSSAAAAAKSERDDQVRKVYERLLKAEAEAESVDGMRAELAEVTADVHLLRLRRQELAAELQRVSEELERSTREAERAATARADIDSLREEIHRGRTAIELEKKTQAHNLDHEREMEKNAMLLTQEIDRLRGKLVDMENKAPTAANPGYGHPDMMYGAASYPDPYSMSQVHDSNRSLASSVPGPIQNGIRDVPKTEVHR